jgi:predicted extracellular nuclease
MLCARRRGRAVMRSFPVRSLLAGFLACSGLPAFAAGSIVISQAYGGGGNSGAPYRHDFIELYNRGTAAVNLAGWSLQYASAAGSTWNNKTDLAGSLAPGQYLLVQQAAGTGGGAALPTPDLSGAIAMSAASGKVALVRSTVSITTGTTCPTGALIEDFLGYGSANCAEGSPAPTLSNTLAALRRAGGATDTDNNAADFLAGTPTPRNSSTSSAQVSLIASDPSASEAGADSGSFTLTRQGGDTAAALAISVTVGGSATGDSDYLPTPGTTLEFPPGVATLQVALTPVDDALVEGTETVTLTLVPGAGYTLATTATAVVSIADDDGPDSAPSVSSVSPVEGATGVGLAVPLVIDFDEQVDIAAGAVRVECPLGIVSAANASALANVSRLSLAGAWPAGTQCTVRVDAAGVRDVDASDPPDALAANFASAFTTTSEVCLSPDTPIGLIQGSGATAALTGTRTVQGVVVGDYEGPDPALRGFYLQNLPAEADGNPATSDALFIFNGDRDDVAVGQVVQVTGPVSEYGFGSTGGTQTQISAQVIEQCGARGEIAVTDISLPFTDDSVLERHEGMLVRFLQALSVTEHYQLGRFGQVLLAGGARLPQPTNVSLPGATAAAVAAANRLNQIVLDDALQTQNPDPVRFGRGIGPLSAANTLRGGDTVSGLRGVLTQTDATTASNVPATSDPVRYRLRPFGALGEEAPEFVGANPRPAAPPPAAHALRVAGFNLLNYFNTFGASSCSNGVGGTTAECRGAENVFEFERQAAKTVQAALGSGADILVVNEIENDGYGADSALQDLIDRLNAATTPGNWAFVDADAGTGRLNALGTDAIKVGILYRPASAMPVGTTATLAAGAFGMFTTTSGAIQRNRPALAQSFEQTGGASRFTVVANHLKSKGSDCAGNLAPVGPDPDTGDGQGNCNLTRTAAAAELIGWLAADPTGAGSAQVLLMGDLNSYALEDPVRTLTTAGYVNLIADRLGLLAYSYVFDGQWGYLDHALANEALAPQVVAVTEWHVNADEPVTLDYNTNFKTPAQQAGFYAADAFRASDHDIVLVDLAPDRDSDGLPDLAEAMLGTDPFDLDSDDDGIPDGIEDANRNGIVDPGETNPAARDTDGDGIPDGVELGLTAGVPDPDGAGPLRGTDPAVFVADADPATTTSPVRADTDGDGLDDGQEDANRNGRVDPGESDPGSKGSARTVRQVPTVTAWAQLGLGLGVTFIALRGRKRLQDLT